MWKLLHLIFAGKKVDVSILTETHINHDQIDLIRNSCLGPIFFSPGDNHTKGLLVLLHPNLEGITEFATDPKGRFVVCVLQGYSL